MWKKRILIITILLILTPLVNITCISSDIQKTKHFSKLLRNMEQEEYIPTVDNPDNVKKLDFALYDGGICNSSEEYDYVIITSNNLSNSWQPLIDHRINFSGLNSTIVTVEQITTYEDYWNVTPLFNDTQAKIREFCKDAYLDWGTEYVLIGGDWRDGVSDEQIVPYRLFTDRYETDTYNTMSCDLYYSNLDGDWYYSPNSIWGGGEGSGVNDKTTELYIGRITAYNSTMVSNAINKIIWYDECNDNYWLNKTSFWGGNLGWSVTSKDYMEELRIGTDTFRTFTGFEEWNNAHPDKQINTTERLYHADLGSNYKNYWSNSAQNDNFSIVNNIEHTNPSIPFGLNNWQSIQNIKPFFGYSQGCLGGRFSSGYAGCEQMICQSNNSNAYALVLNTGYGYASDIDTDGPAQTLNCYFWDYFFNNTANETSEWQLGKAQAYSKDKMSPMIDGTDHAWCYNWYSTHLFGDPAQTLKIDPLSNSPPNLSNENPASGSINVNISFPTLSVNISDLDGNPMNCTLETSHDIISQLIFPGSESTHEIGGTHEGTSVNMDDSHIGWQTWMHSTSFTLTEIGGWFRKSHASTSGACHISIRTTSGGTPTSTELGSVDILENNFPLSAQWFYITFPTPIKMTGGVTYAIYISCSSSGGHYVEWGGSGMDNPYPRGQSVLSINSDMQFDILGYDYLTNGTITCDISLNYFTLYTWYVNLTDGTDWTNESYTFTTELGTLFPWDIVTDRAINYLDVSSLVNHYGQTGTPHWIRDDINEDGEVNYLDVSLLVSHYGEEY